MTLGRSGTTSFSFVSVNDIAAKPWLADSLERSTATTMVFVWGGSEARPGPASQGIGEAVPRALARASFYPALHRRARAAGRALPAARWRARRTFACRPSEGRNCGCEVSGASDRRGPSRPQDDRRGRALALSVRSPGSGAGDRCAVRWGVPAGLHSPRVRTCRRVSFPSRWSGVPSIRTLVHPAEQAATRPPRTVRPQLRCLMRMHGALSPTAPLPAPGAVLGRARP